MNSKLSKPSLLGITVLVASAIPALAGAGGFDHVAYLGLVPPASGMSTDFAEPGMDSRRHPGLKLPRDVIGRGGAALDFLGGSDGGPMAYSGTRAMSGLTAANSRAIGGMLYPLSGNWFSTVEASIDGASPLSTRGYGLLGQVHKLLPGGWGVSLGLNYNVYESGASRLQGSASEPFTLPSQAWPVHPAAGNTFTTSGYELRLNYRYGERNSLGVTYGSGSELDYTRQMLGMQPGEGRQFGLTGEHWLTPDWAVNYGLMAQEQIGPHRGQGLRLGVRYRF